MTDSQNNDVEGLPTAFCQKVNYTASDGTMKEKLKLGISQKFKAELKDGDELVRRKDVESLIQDKIEKLHNLNTQFQEEHRDIPYPVKENIDQLKKELLEELEQ